MAQNNYTPSQQAVIDSENCNLLVSAGAGSGKTTVLVEKATGQILNKKVTLKELLIVTFTESASSEMKQRLGAKLSEYATDPTVANELENINNCDICTLHSFCQKIIKQYFYELNIDSAFGIIDDNDAKYLKAQILQDIIENQSKQYDQAFEALTEVFYRGRRANNLKDNILSFYEFLQTDDNKQNFVKSIAKSCYEQNLDINPACILINKKVVREITYYKKTFSKFLQQASQLNAVKLQNFVQQVLDVLEHISSDNSFSVNFENSKLLYTLSSNLGYIKDEDMALRDDIDAVWKQFADARKKIKEMYCSDTLEQIQTNLSKASLVIDKFIELTMLFEKEFTKHKQQKNVLDFNDLEKYALRLLSNDTLRQTLMQKYKSIYIDEYQDINNVQESILQLLTNGNNLVMVGDIKQSIYAFRNSSPQIFIDKKDAYSCDDSKGQLIKLNENFRSNPEILDFINDIFVSLMTQDFGGINYAVDGKFNGKAEYDKVSDLPTVSVNIINTQNTDEEEPPQGVYDIKQDILDDEVSSKQLEAMFVSKKITELVGRYEIYDAKKKSSHKISYKDITILCRTRNTLKEFATLLIKNNIPVSANLKESLFDNADIMFLVSILKIINNPNDDVSLATVLSHDLVGFSFDELITIRKQTEQENFYQAYLSYQENSDNLAMRLRDINEYFEYLRKDSKYMSIYELLIKIEKDFGILNYCLALPGGRDRHSLINDFIDSFSGSSYNNDLVGYLDYVDNYLKDSVTDSSIIAVDDCVRLDTIHSSKGLEYNIVFLVGAGEKFSNQSSREDIVKDKTLGLGINYYDTDTRGKFDTVAKKAILFNIKQSEILEETRLLYVALSRAKNHLYVVGKTDITKINPYASEYELQHSNNYLDWILPSLGSAALKSLTMGTKSMVINNETRPLEVKVFDKQDFDLTTQINQTSFDDTKIDKELFEQIDNYLNKPYKYLDSTTIALKNSVTSLMTAFDGYESINLQPKLFALGEHNTNKDTDYAKLGTAYHTVMQHADFGYTTISQVKDLVDNLISDKVFEVEYLKKVEPNKILNAIKALQAFDTTNVLKEKQFMMYVPYKELIQSSTLEDKVLLQGVIDLVILGDKNILIDYKTTKTQTPEQLVEKYDLQMKLYKLATEYATGKPIDQVYIYSFYHNKLVKVF